MFLHQLTGPFPPDKTTEERLYLRLARNPTTKASSGTLILPREAAGKGLSRRLGDSGTNRPETRR